MALNLMRNTTESQLIGLPYNDRVEGRYRNADYVQSYTLDTPDLASLIGQLKQMERSGVVRRLDGPPMVRAVFEREFDGF